MKLTPLLLILILAPLARAAETPKWIISGSERNDLFRLISRDNPGGVQRFATPAAAIEAAAEGAAVLVLADAYPETRTPVNAGFFDAAKRKNLRLYVEYPAFLPAIEMPKLQTATWERGVIASNAFGDALPKLRIVSPHACQFIPLDARENELIGIARVAGFDTAVYGLPAKHSPLLFELNDGRWLIATTKLSGFVTARYAPSADWANIWTTILARLSPEGRTPKLAVEPIAAPARTHTDSLPADFQRQSFDAAVKWFLHSRLLVHPSRKAQIHELLAKGVEEIDPPDADAPIGDGSLGILEGYSSAIRHDGSQRQRLPLRADCNAESAMVLALGGQHEVATNLLNYTFSLEMQGRERLDKKHPAYGLIAWGAIAPAWQTGNYGDDNARVILAAILASSALKSDRWNEPISRGILANFRTTGELGFRGDRIDIPALEQHGWKHFHDAKTINYAPHFESYLWACYFWAYQQTGDRALLDKTENAIAMIMAAYEKKQWRLMDNSERARMLLCLSWLVRVRDSEQHRHWLSIVAHDLLESQDTCGAIAERLGGHGGGHYQIPQSNDAYGTAETPLIQQNGDPASDQLYTTGFALLALHEAAAATGGAKLKSAEDRLAEFLCRIQVRSKIPYLDGTWFRAFDFRRWDYWASSADMGWGVWSVEAGWGQAWIAATLALRERGTSFWEITSHMNLADSLKKGL